MKTITAVIIGAWWTGYWQFHDQKNEQSRRKTNVFKNSGRQHTEIERVSDFSTTV